MRRLIRNSLVLLNLSKPLARSTSQKFMDHTNKEQLKKRLTKLQWEVTQNSATEPPYKNEYYKEKRTGDYFCIVCNQKLFESDLKYDSGCGWPAFHSKSKEASIKEISDLSHGMVRVEVRCGKCDAHLGHVFEDGPVDKGGIRYCINSASIDFTPKQNK